MPLIEADTGRVVLPRLTVAAAMLPRMLGLLGRTALADDEGMYFPDCRMIHTWFMRMPIDVVFLDDAGIIRDLRPALPPWRVAGCRKGGRHTLELGAGAAARLGLAPGGRLLVASS
ncbi:MAG: DUF192 domain-containing protein [Kiritimatiellia bacterium]